MGPFYHPRMQYIFLLSLPGQLVIYAVFKGLEKALSLARRGWRTQLSRWEKAKLITGNGDRNRARFRVTKNGKAAAFGGRDPLTHWNRRWDGRWRFLIFDLPRNRPALRMKLWRWLRRNYFGLAQGSWWIHPDPAPEITPLREFRRRAKKYVTVETKRLSVHFNRVLTLNAWPFDTINARYAVHIKIAEECVRRISARPVLDKTAGKLLQRECAAWNEAILSDPLLPRALWPLDYLGEKAWKARNELATVVRRTIEQDRAQVSRSRRSGRRGPS